MLMIMEKSFNKFYFSIIFVIFLCVQFYMEFYKDYFQFKEIIPGIIALLGFIFTTRTFLLFKLKEMLMSDTKRMEDFQRMQKEGIIPKGEHYFSKLNRLDQYFDTTQSILCFSVGIISLAKLLKHNIVMDMYLFSSSEFLSMISNASCFCVIYITIVITVLTGKTLKNIIQDNHGDKEKTKGNE